MKVIDKLIEIANGEDVGGFRIPNAETGDVRDSIFELENGRLRNRTSGKWVEVQLGIDDWEDIGSWFLNQEVEEVDIKQDFYLCSPLLNNECSKTNCYINNGSCCHTVNKEYSQESLIEKARGYIQKLDIREKNDDSNYLISTKDYMIQEKINEIIDVINDPREDR